MASNHHQFYSDYTNFYAEIFGLHCTTDASSSEETSPILFNNNNYAAAAINTVPFMGTTSCDQYKLINSSPVSVASFPEQQFGVSDFIALPPEYYDNTGFALNYYSKDQYCGGLEGANNIKPAYNNNSMASENWGIKGEAVLTKVEESTEVKVGRYSVEEKKHRILRYLHKRNQRNFNKTIKYACRKTLADKRVRVRGRFAKNNEPGDQDEMEMKMYPNSYEQINYSLEDAFKIKYEEDDLLQAAMAKLVHFPYTPS